MCVVLRLLTHRFARLLFCLLLAVAGESGAASSARSGSETVLTNIAQLRAAASSTWLKPAEVHLDAIVCWSDEGGGLLALQDDSGAAFFAAGPLTRRVKPGDRLSIQALASAKASYFKLSALPTQSASSATSSGAASQAGEQNIRWEITARGNFPKPRIVAPGQSLPDEDCRWSQVEGKVTFVGKGVGKVILELTAGSGKISVEIPDSAPFALPLLLHSQVRASGMCENSYTVDGYRSPSRLLVPGTAQLELVELAAKHWNAYPLTSIDKAIEQVKSRGSRVVRIQGTATNFSERNGFLMKDSTGEIRVQLSQALHEKPDEVIEAIGQIEEGRDGLILLSAVCRKVEPIGPRILPVLRTTEEVHGLKPEEAEAKYPVRIRGVVTSRDSDGGMVQDGTRGVYVYGLRSKDSSSELRIGDYIELEGVTVRGDFAPMITCRSLTRLGHGSLPEPVKPTWERLNNGSMDCQYIEMEGFVTEAYWNSLVLLMPEGYFGVAIVPDAGVDLRSYRLEQYANKHIRIRGTVFATRINETRRVRPGSVGIGNAVIGLGNPVPTLEKNLGELLEFDARAAGFHRVKVAGQILHTRQGDYWLSDGTNALRFVTRANSDITAGDFVEVIGFPRLASSAPVLLEAAPKKIGKAPLPAGRVVNAEELASGSHIGTLVQIEARLLGIRSTRSDWMLDLQAGSRTLIARLERSKGDFSNTLPTGSRLRLTGVYAGHGKDSVTGADSESSELLLNSRADISLLERPSWWTPGRALTVICSLLGVLLLAGAWVISLRGQVEARTSELKDEIEERKRVQAEVEQVHKKLVDASRKAGMAQIATGVLHNVGNVLNSVNVSANILTENTRNSRLQSLTQLANLLDENSRNLPQFLADDPRGQRIPRLLRNLEGHFRKEQDLQLQELEDLKKHIEHVKETVAMQQYYAKNSSTVYEFASLIEIVEDALRLQAAAFVRHEISVVREYAPVPAFYLDRHKVLQILVNLLSNAKEACDEKGPGPKKIIVRITAPEYGHVKVEVEDSGIGIAPENLQKIFSYGFTTRAKGHGYGLHSSANAAAEMRSTLVARSAGVGKGAAFILTIPCLESPEPPPLPMTMAKTGETALAYETP
jgi:signal transduction histidine kinase